MRRFVGVTCVAIPILLVACQPDMVAPVPQRAVPSDQSGVGLVRNAPLVANLANLNQCDQGPAIRDSKNKFLHWAAERRTVEVAYANADSQPELYRIMHFDKDGFEAYEAVCVLRKGAAAEAFIQSLYRKMSGPLTTGTGFPIASITDGDKCYYVGAAHDEVNCEGEHCFLWATRPLTGMRASAAAVEGTGWFTGPIANAYGDTFYCTGGGTLFDRGNGTAYYNPLGGPPPEDYNPPTPDGGGCASNTPAPAPGDTNSDGSPKLPEMRRLFANTCTVVPPAPECTGDSVAVGQSCVSEGQACWFLPFCLKTLADSTKARLQGYVSSLKKTGSLPVCDSLVTRLGQAFANGDVYAGRTSGAPWGSMPHAARRDGNLMHIDPAFLNNDSPTGRAIVVSAMLHEAAHMLGYPSHTEVNATGTQTQYPYTELPWTVNNACVTFPP